MMGSGVIVKYRVRGFQCLWRERERENSILEGNGNNHGPFWDGPPRFCIQPCLAQSPAHGPIRSFPF